MGFKFKRAKRHGVHIILGLMGGTFSGKTWSALELATGLSGGEKFAYIDTEAERALMYADDFDFWHGDLSPPFSPDAYLEAILAAEKGGYKVIVVDSMSHEHAGEGGLLEMHDDELNRMAGNDYNKRDRCNMLAWSKPKQQHKKMVSRLLQLRSHLILCFRAEPKFKPMKAEKNGREVTEFVDVGWQPICAKGLEFELTGSWMLRRENPGHVAVGREGFGEALKVPSPLLPFFQDEYRLSRAHGTAIAEWAAGSSATPSCKDVVSEFISSGQLTGKKANEALVQAGIKDSNTPIPESTDVDLVRTCLTQAAVKAAEEKGEKS